MDSVSCICDIEKPLVLDTSVVVNLNATGFAEQVLRALPVDVFVPVPVLKELQLGEKKGYSDATDLACLLERGLVEPLEVPERSYSEYIGLVSGSASTSLGDGEAATIVSALATNACAAIDERKARRICATRYKEVNLASSVDILAHPKVIASLSKKEFSAAILAALEVANMQVQKRHIDWVVDHIDPVRLGNCLSLPRAVRTAKARKYS